MSKLRKKMPKKTSISTAIQFAHDGSIDLETPDSILSQVNLRSLLNKSTFLKLPPEYQYKLSLLLPQVDKSGGKLNHSSLNNEFFAKATQEWKERLLRGDFTPESMAKTKAEIERDKAKTDPWKVKHFEPVWGIQKDFVAKVEQEEQEHKRHTRSSRAIKDDDDVKDEVLDETDDEDEPLLKKLKTSSSSFSPEKEQKVFEEIVQPELILDVLDDEDHDIKDQDKETVIEEPVDLLDEVDGVAINEEPPDLDEVSIPSPIIGTPSGSPPALPKEPLDIIPSASPASIRSNRGNSITFSSSRSPSPGAVSQASQAESQAESQSSQEELTSESGSVKSQDQATMATELLKIPISEVDVSLLQTKQAVVKPKMKNPTAMVNKAR